MIHAQSRTSGEKNPRGFNAGQRRREVTQQGDAFGDLSQQSWLRFKATAVNKTDIAIGIQRIDNSEQGFGLKAIIIKRGHRCHAGHRLCLAISKAIDGADLKTGLYCRSHKRPSRKRDNQ